MHEHLLEVFKESWPSITVIERGEDIVLEADQQTEIETLGIALGSGWSLGCLMLWILTAIFGAKSLNHVIASDQKR